MEHKGPIGGTNVFIIILILFMLSHYRNAQAAMTKWVMPAVHITTRVDYILPNPNSLWTQSTYVYGNSTEEDIYKDVGVLCILYYDIEKSNWFFNVLQGQEYNATELDPLVPSTIRTFEMGEIPFIFEHVVKILMEAYNKKVWPEPDFQRIH